jgi:hypothetical protein
MPLRSLATRARERVAGACVDDRNIAENAYFDAFWRQSTYCHRSRSHLVAVPYDSLKFVDKKFMLPVGVRRLAAVG